MRGGGDVGVVVVVCLAAGILGGVCGVVIGLFVWIV